ncbi:hypothetical protein, partial [Yersinia enterocolitica]|uniref:hypothetical protein n=1 Tax=Yersinia enterocolitica TaxID=630 RepID=UPI001C6099AF
LPKYGVGLLAQIYGDPSAPSRGINQQELILYGITTQFLIVRMQSNQPVSRWRGSDAKIQMPPLPENSR